MPASRIRDAWDVATGVPTEWVREAASGGSDRIRQPRYHRPVQPFAPAAVNQRRPDRTHASTSGRAYGTVTSATAFGPRRGVVPGHRRRTCPGPPLGSAGSWRAGEAAVDVATARLGYRGRRSSSAVSIDSTTCGQHRACISSASGRAGRGRATGTPGRSASGTTAEVVQPAGQARGQGGRVERSLVADEGEAQGRVRSVAKGNADGRGAVAAPRRRRGRRRSGRNASSRAVVLSSRAMRAGCRGCDRRAMWYSDRVSGGRSDRRSFGRR